MLCALVFLTFCFSTVSLLPLIKDDQIPVASNVVHPGAACSYSGKMPSDNPCIPWCVCRQGRAVCAKVFCSTDIPNFCDVVTVHGRCCPTLMCKGNQLNGTAAIRYDLPLTEIPADFFKDDMDSSEK